jgi:hypothetical protein
MARGCGCGSSFKGRRGVKHCPHCDTPCLLRPCSACKAIGLTKDSIALKALDEGGPRLEPPGT